MVNWADFDVKFSDEENECVGRYYRFRRTTYKTKYSKWGEKQEFYLLKRLSCSGCEVCGWEDDALSAEIDAEMRLPDCSHLEDGDVFKIVISLHGGFGGDIYDDIMDIHFARVDEDKLLKQAD